MRRFFYCQPVLGKKISDHLGLDLQLLISKPPAERLVRQCRVLDFLYQYGDRFRRCGLSVCFDHSLSLLSLLLVNDRIGGHVHVMTLMRLPLQRGMVSQRPEKRTRSYPQKRADLSGR